MQCPGSLSAEGLQISPPLAQPVCSISTGDMSLVSATNACSVLEGSCLVSHGGKSLSTIFLKIPTKEKEVYFLSVSLTPGLV